MSDTLAPAATSIDWQKAGGLVPAVVQDAATLRVLMVGYMNEAGFMKTLDTGLVTFYSRSKGRLWTKGESSGHHLRLVRMEKDCDADALLVLARPAGPTCHRGEASCFGSVAPSTDLGFLEALTRLVGERRATQPEGSYTTSLFAAGLSRMAQKVGEEALEVALAAKDEDQDAFLGEAADLVFHLMVLLEAKGSSLAEVGRLLEQRAAPRTGR
jgi:phosphoribosyl-ATP pyrophosphohydrolase/phosphoribosyl-AMP cyclohydrolase